MESAIPAGIMDGGPDSLTMVVEGRLARSVHDRRHSVGYERVPTAAVMVDLILLVK